MTTVPPTGLTGPAGLIDEEAHARWDQIEAEVRAERGEAPRSQGPAPMGTDHAAVYHHPFAPPAGNRPAGMSHFGSYRPARGLAALTQLGLAATSLLSALLLWSLWIQRDVLARLDAGESTLGADIAASDESLGRWFVIRLLLLLATGVAFLAWFSRSYKNTNAVNPWDPTRRTPGWAVGAWFVPFLNWVRPVSMANEMWRKSESPHASAPTPATILWVWWPCWLIGGVGMQMPPDIGGALEAGVTVEAMKLFNAIWMFGLVTSLVGGLAALMMVGTLTERLDRRFVELRAWEEQR